MSPNTRLVLFALLGAAAGAFDGGVLLGGAVGALLALHLNDRERLRELDARLRAVTARVLALDASPTDAVVQDPVVGDLSRLVDADPVGDAPDAASEEPDAVERQPDAVERQPDAVRPEVVPPPPVGDAAPDRLRPRIGRPPRPTAPPLLDRLPPELRRVWDFATGGNAMARLGLLLLFVGLGLGIRLAVDAGLLSVTLRLIGSGVVGLSLMGLGWRLRNGTPGFGLTVQGGGVAVLYLTVYAAYALYGLLPSLLAITMMGAIAVVCGALAVLQNAPGLALLGVAGGFAAPVLAGTSEGNHVLLLAYYALLNLGVLGVAWGKGWRSVAVVWGSSARS